MDPDTLAPRGPLGTALIPVAAHGGLATAQPLPQNPAEVLASLMDFPGSVAVADLLNASESRVQPNPQAHSLAERMLEDVRARLDSLEPLALKPLMGRRGPELPTPDQLLLSLKKHGLPRARIEGAGVPDAGPEGFAFTRAADALAVELGAPFRAALGTSLRQAQAHVATLRWEIAHDLRQLGPRADQMERLDAALTRSMQGKMGELLDRMEHAAQATFARACAHALAELFTVEASLQGDANALPSAEALAAWCAADGWIGRYHERCVRMAKALFGHLRRGLEGLVRAAAHAEET
jgi:hypothetical protein